MGRLLVVSLALAAVLVLAASCTRADGSGDDPSESLPWQTESSSATEADLTPEDAAISAVENYWQAVDEAAAIPDPAYGPLEELAGGQALEAAQSIAQSMVDQGQKQNGEAAISELAVLELTPEGDPTTILVGLCMDTSTAVIVDADTGTAVPGEEYGRRDSRAQVVKTDVGWIVDVVNVQEIGTC